MATPYASLPASWSNKRKVERLRADAYASLTRMLSRAVAETGVNFSIYSALRTTAEQHALFVKNYRNTGKSYANGDRPRKYKGTWWARRPGSVAVAVPGSERANHEGGVAIDIHPAAIQNWIKRNGGRFGWDWAEGKRNGEDWHFRYYPAQDRYKSEGLLDHAAVQKAVGAAVDGKIGTGTVGKIKAFQKAHNLDVDGKVGPATKKALGLSGKGDAAPAPAIPVGPVGGASVPAPQPESVATLPALPTVETDKVSPNANSDRKGHSVKHITVHWWGKPSGQSFDGIVNWLCDPKANVSAHYVISADRVARIVDESHRSWANGNGTANSESITIECDPNDVLGTLPVLAALVKDIRSRWGDLPIYPHQHWTSTECPGDYLPHLDAVDDLARTGKTVVNTPPIITPSTGGDMPEGKELLMKLQDIPDFPLLRTPGNLCYYGDDEKQTSVTGKMPNSLVPGEIFGSGKSSGAHGLKVWQKRAGIEADGRFGAGTKAKVREVQKKAGLSVDGKLGPTTWYALWLVD